MRGGFRIRPPCRWGRHGTRPGRSGGGAAVRGHRRALARARHDRGPARRARRAHVPDRHAHRARAAARRRSRATRCITRCCSRTSAARRRPRACASCSAPTTSRSRRTASSSTGRSRPQVARYTSRHVAAGWPHRARASARSRCCARWSAEGKAIVETRCDRGAAIVSEPRLPGGERAEAVCGARRALGRQRAAVAACRATRSRSLARIACLSADRRGLLRDARRRARRTRWCASAAGAGSTRRSPTSLLAIGPDDRAVGRPARATTCAALVRDLEPADRVAGADEAGTRPRLRGVRGRHRREVAVHRPPLARRRDLRRPDRPRARPRPGRSCATCAAPGCCTTSASSAIPNTILDKPGKLTDEEFAAIRLHPALHARASSRGIPAFAPLRRGRRGPPRAPGRPRLPPRRAPPATSRASARVLAVADVFEALTADRPYRGPMDPAEALAIAREDPGHLDQSCVEALAAGVERAAERFAA